MPWFFSNLRSNLTAARLFRRLWTSMSSTSPSSSTARSGETTRRERAREPDHPCPRPLPETAPSYHDNAGLSAADRADPVAAIAQLQSGRPVLRSALGCRHLRVAAVHGKRHARPHADPARYRQADPDILADHACRSTRVAADRGDQPFHRRGGSPSPGFVLAGCWRDTNFTLSYKCSARPSAFSADSWNASPSAGCAWIVLAMSSSRAPISSARPKAVESSEISWPTAWMPSTR